MLKSSRKTCILQGHIHERDYQTYKELYETVMEFLPAPDLVIYLRASVPTLEERIAKRGREYERSISAGLFEQPEPFV